MATSLGKFEGKPVIATNLIVRGTGDGLSAAMKVDPNVYKHGDRLVIAVEAVVRDIRFDPVDKTEPDGEQVRVHITFAETATVLGDADAAGDVQAALDAQRDRIQRAKDAEEGVLRLPTDEELLAAHDAGEHDELVDGCVECDREQELVAAGK